MIDAGGIGEVTSINLYQGSPQISGGGCQGISVLRMFANDAEIDWLSGWCGGDPWSDGDQNMGGHIRFKTGLDAFIHNKRASKNGIEVIGEKGVFYADFESFRLFKYRGDEKSRLYSDLVEVPGLFPDAKHWGPDLDADGWQSMSTRQAHSIQSMIDAMDQDIEPRCSGEDMRKALEIAIAFRESHRRGHAPVKLPIQDRSQKIVPVDRRLKNKKETMGEAAYKESISSHTRARTPAD
ncbi:MAG: hypothetical protein FJ319_06355 [SAR202 cluster bacterium]|nr:hypothetical protein [SAR202 cluster bacterium]